MQLILATLDSRIQTAKHTAAQKGAQALTKLKGSFGGLWSKVAAFAGAAWTKISKYFNFSWSNLFDQLINAYFAIKFFDWNATDAELEKMKEANNQRMLNLIAENVGEQVGFKAVELVNTFVGGGLKGAKEKSVVRGVRIPKISKSVALALAEERNDELEQGVRSVLNATINTQLSNAFISGVLQLRNLKLFGFEPITKEQSNGSLQAKLESQIEKLPKWLQQPVENLIEGIEDGIIEAGYIVTSTVDEELRAMRLAASTGVKREISVKLEPDSDVEYYFNDGQDNLINEVKTLTSVVAPAIASKDIGEFYGEAPNTTQTLIPQKRALTLNYNSYSRPPYMRKGKAGWRATITIPDVKTGLSYADLRTVETYQRGNVLCTCKFVNGRQFMGYFSSQQEGERVFSRLARLSTVKLDLTTFRFSKGQASANTDNTGTAHIQFAALIHPRDNKSGKTTKSGKNRKVQCWNSVAPSNFENLR